MEICSELTLTSSSFFLEVFLGVDLAEFVSGVVEEEGEEVVVLSPFLAGHIFSQVDWYITLTYANPRHYTP